MRQYSNYWRERRIMGPDALTLRRPRGRRAAGSTPGRAVGPEEASPAAHGSKPLDRNAPGRGPKPGPALKPARASRASGPATLRALCHRRVSARSSVRERAGFGGGLGFVSFDLPMEEHPRRRRLLSVLRAAGYAPLHASMYVGPGLALSAAVMTLEEAGFMAHLRWGSLRIFER